MDTDKGECRCEVVNFGDHVELRKYDGRKDVYVVIGRVPTFAIGGASVSK